MSFNGNGVFVRLYNWVNDKNNGINILASRMDSEMNGFATGLTDCVTRDGQSPATANLPMGGFIHTNVGTGTARTNYATLAQVEDGVISWQAAGGTVDAITINLTPAIITLIDGQSVFVRAAGTNLTTSPSLSVNGSTPATITKQGGGALNGSDWSVNTELFFRYNLAATHWEWVNALASQSSTFSDSAFKIQDNGDSTKQLAFEVSGVTTGTTRTLTVPNVNGTIVTTGDTATVTNTMLATAPALTVKLNATNATASDTDFALSAKQFVIGNDAGTALIAGSFGSGLTVTAGVVTGGIQQIAAQTTSGAATYAFTGIPSTVKRIIVNFRNVNSASSTIVGTQIMVAGTAVITGYTGFVGSNSVSAGAGAADSTFVHSIYTAGTTPLYNGRLVFENMTGNIWSYSHGGFANAVSGAGGGSIALAGVPTGITIMNSAAATFSGGTAQVSYE